MSWTSRELYKLLNGLLVMYKPPNYTIEKFGEQIQYFLAKGFNSLPAENERIITQVVRNLKETKIITVPDLLSLPQITGPNFYPTDFEMYAANPLSTFSSGVQVVGIGPVGLALSAKLFEGNSYVNVYRITCMMGRSTYSGTPDSVTFFRTGWKRVKKHNLDFILQNRLQHFITFSYMASGLIPNSQEAYDAISNSSGLLRPKVISAEDRDNCDPVRKQSPIVYGLNCVEFNPPFFTVEMHVINEDFDFIIEFIKDLGNRLKTGTVLTKCRRIRHGRFTADFSLLLKDLKYFDPSIIAAHINTSNELHSFESLQTDNKNFLIKNNNFQHASLQRVNRRKLLN